MLLLLSASSRGLVGFWPTIDAPVGRVAIRCVFLFLFFDFLFVCFFCLFVCLGCPCILMTYCIHPGKRLGRGEGGRLRRLWPV